MDYIKLFQNMKCVKVIHAYDAAEAGHLSINIGEIIQVIGPGESADWQKGRNTSGEEGYFPVSYVKGVVDPPLPPPVPEISNRYIEKEFEDDNCSQASVAVKQRIRKSKNIPSFTAEESSMKIFDWMPLYEHSVDAHERLDTLQSLLGGTKVLTWFAQEIIPRMNKITWDDCKTRMLKRFGGTHSRPLIAAFDRKLEKGDTIENYYTEKIALLNLTSLPDADKVALLTHGIPKGLQTFLESGLITTPDIWLQYATVKFEEWKDVPKNMSKLLINKDGNDDE